MTMNSRKPSGLYPVREDPKVDAEIKIMLTTVCIKAGVVRVPHRHQPTFMAANYSFEFNGLSQSIEYADTGHLTGLRALFEEAEARPNDALILHLSGNIAAISFSMRERKAYKEAPSAATSAAAPAVEQPAEVKTIRKVRINTQQYYPLDVPLPSSLAGEDTRVATTNRVNVTERRRPPVEPIDQQESPRIEQPPAPTEESTKEYQVSEDFERWVTTPNAPEVTPLFGEATVEPEASRPNHQSPDLVMRSVEAYLSRPDIPAVVQTQTIANELAIDINMCERALERISEDHERVSRIRAGAYMIRQKRATTKV